MIDIGLECTQDQSRINKKRKICETGKDVNAKSKMNYSWRVKACNGRISCCYLPGRVLCRLRSHSQSPSISRNRGIVALVRSCLAQASCLGRTKEPQSTKRGQTLEEAVISLSS